MYTVQNNSGILHAPMYLIGKNKSANDSSREPQEIRLVIVSPNCSAGGLDCC